MKSIQNKLLLVVISGLVLMIVLVTGVAVHMTHEVMHRDADRILNRLCEKEAAEINGMLNEMKTSVGIMEHYASEEFPGLDGIGSDSVRAPDEQKLKSLFCEIIAHSPEIDGAYVRFLPALSSPTAGFYVRTDGNGNFQDVSVTDLSKYDEDDERNTGWYYTAVKTGESVWYGPYFFPGNENQLVSYITPFYVNEKLVGIIGVDLEFSYLVDRINGITVYEEGYAVLLGNDNETVYNMNDEEIQKKDTSNPHTKATALLLNGMNLEIRADYQDIQSEIRPVLYQIMVSSALVLVVFILLTILVTRKIVAPLKSLTHSAQRIADGETDVTFAIQSRDEIGTLASVLDQTYQKVREYTRYINALAYRDSLTGIKNRTAYSEAVEEMEKSIQLGNPSFGVLVVDINDLKTANDTYGHDVGDDMIVYTSKLLSDVFKHSAVFRIGGDEFVVLLQGRDLETYRHLLDELEERIKSAIVFAGEEAIALSLAKGISFYDPQIDQVYDDVFIKADHAMYLHKQSQKNAVV